jgi:hypothetical protein
MSCKETAQPIRDESYPHLPSEPVRKEVEKITKITAAMSNNRSTVQPTARENVAKELRKAKILNQELLSEK